MTSSILFTNPERIHNLLLLNGSAGCSSEYLREKLGVPNRAAINMSMMRLNRGLEEAGQKVVHVDGRYHIMTRDDAQIEHEERLYG